MNITSTYFYFCVLYYAILQIIAPTLSVGWLIVIYVTLFILIMRKPQWLYYFYGLLGVVTVVSYRYFIVDVQHTLFSINQQLAKQDIYYFPLLKDAIPPIYYAGVTIALAFIPVFLIIRRPRRSYLVISYIFFLVVQMISEIPLSLAINSLVLFLFLLGLQGHLSFKRSKWLIPIVVLLVLANLTITTEKKLPILTKANATVSYYIERIFYNKGQDFTLPMGNLTKVKEKSKSDEVELTVVMSENRPLYLRGFTGEIFQHSSWDNLKGIKKQSYKSIVDALEKEAFMPTMQYALAQQSSLTTTLFVRNQTGNRKFTYTPYELVQINQLNRRNSEQQLAEKGYYEYPALATSLYDSETDYLTYESHYNKAVYQAYLQVEKDDFHLLNTQFEELITHTKSYPSYEEIITKTIDAIQDKITYDEHAKYTDIVLPSLLEEKRLGYDIHYATLGTLLFRIQGIPARYVEGYILTNDDIAGVTNYQEISLTAKSSHAWTEIYMDKLGWLPIEVTPGYAEKMPPITSENYPKNHVNTTSGTIEETMTDEPISQVMDELVPDTEEDESTQDSNVTWLLLWLIVIGSGVGFILLISKRFKKFKHMKSRNHQIAIQSTYEYIVKMLYQQKIINNPTLYQAHTRVEENLTANQYNLFLRATELYELTKYAQQPCSIKQHQEILRIMKALRGTLLRKNKGRNKLYFLYLYY